MQKRLQNIIAHAGIASRRTAGEMIEAGRVKVDGHVVTEKGLKFDPADCSILVDEKALKDEEKKFYFLFNKPKGIISTVKDTHGRKKITDFFKDIDARLYPVGRLDKDTTGVIIVTNDGDLAHKLSHPSFEVDKEYCVTVSGSVPFGAVNALKKGVEIDGEMTTPCEIKISNRSEDNTVLQVKLHEGRKRQIRRMFE